jgi:hypothetical protein
MHDDDGSVRSRAEVQELLASWTSIPAFLCDRHFTVVAANDTAQALSPGFGPGMNLARFAFLEPDVDREHAMWHEASGQVAALLRESLDEHDADAGFRKIVGELSVHSRDFSVAWADDTRRAKSRGVIPFDDTPVGRITLGYEVYTVPGSDDDVLFIWRPVDDESRDRLRELRAVRGQSHA